MKIRIRKPAAPAAPAEEQPAPVDLTGLLPAGLQHGDLTPNRILSPQENLEAFLGRKPPPVSAEERRGIIARIRRGLAEALAQTPRLSLPVDDHLVPDILDALIAEAAAPGPRPPNDGSVRAWFIASAFDDLVQLPSNIFDRVTAADGTEHYLPIPAAVWLECLHELRSATARQAFAPSATDRRS